jgi:hypothetical protein
MWANTAVSGKPGDLELLVSGKCDAWNCLISEMVGEKWRDTLVRVGHLFGALSDNR